MCAVQECAMKCHLLLTAKVLAWTKLFSVFLSYSISLSFDSVESTLLVRVFYPMVDGKGCESGASPFASSARPIPSTVQ